MAFQITVSIFYVANLRASGPQGPGKIKSGIAKITVKQTDPSAVIPYIELYESLEKSIVDDFSVDHGLSETIDVDCVLHKFDVLLPHKNVEFFPSEYSRHSV